MRKIQAQGIHHITLTGADRQTSIDFWEGLLGFSLIFDQPNLDDQSQGHLYFAAGNGQTITVFTDESRKPSGSFLKDQIGAVHHLAFSVSRVVLTQVSERLKERGIKHTPVKDRGFMNSIYFHDPLGLRVELACYRFEPPEGSTHADVLAEAHRLRVANGDTAIADIHLADAIENITAKRQPRMLD
ncbi:MAG: VOC family protein [Paracoccaceae bacterium]|jgi:catechol 2,3-dioxygenase-like lactoylglutathione lyase family enzyme|nr:VOC family protein [Paracoccaceae bacterium]OUU99083.1 MAG: glyoxalase [Cellvibrionales bacterium TMED79]WQC62416.1 VOC family protein [Alphaproteobacteria bacterium US3C007]MDA8542656.1 VOC family protein [Paracoccaceae bacterium]MDG1017280.1 VOC family protein [Paracoccaceae bacterium]|tara:strand:- start:6247 stop:6804 length:558 start_codon:yes stop_codon:yes gene_type:complete